MHLSYILVIYIKITSWLVHISSPLIINIADD